MKYIYVLLLALFVISSCNDSLLEKSPLDSLSPDVYFRSADECKLLVTGLYSAMSFSDYLTLDDYTDDLFSGAGRGSEYAYVQGTLQTNDSYAKNRWVDAYKQIGLANLAVIGIETAPIADGLKKQFIAEAKFFRAYYYSDLVRLFGDVPLVLTKPSLKENLTPERADKAKILTQIVSDLDFAIQNLPVSFSGNDKGRATKGTALALKARVLLSFEKWTEAAAAAKQCMDLNVYSLFADYKGLFTEANEYNKEVIFDIGYIRDLRPSERNMNLLRQNIWLPTLSLANEYETADGKMITDAGSGFNPQNPSVNRDPRFNLTICFPGTVREGITKTDGSPVIYIPAGDLSETSMTLRKSADYADVQNNNSGINFIVYRYADILLMFAEATNEVSGATSDVYNAVNQVRGRVGMPNLPAGLSKDEMRMKIRHERRVEFGGEGIRYFDMIRWHIADQVLAKNKEGYDKKTLVDPADPTQWIFTPITIFKTSWSSDKGYLWPIPLDEIKLNSNLTQNPGYN